jgi:hypothetical protein
LERDRADDESGNQIAVFGRIGSRPFNLNEMQRLFLKNDGQPWYVGDTLPGSHRDRTAKPVIYDNTMK